MLLHTSATGATIIDHFIFNTDSTLSRECSEDQAIPGTNCNKTGVAGGVPGGKTSILPGVIVYRSVCFSIAQAFPHTGFLVPLTQLDAATTLCSLDGGSSSAG